jgi:ferric-dicitrate binding protein FerR (iron transport regulator)
MTEREDDDIERVLARYRPAGPPATLRARVLAPRQSAVRHLAPWLSIAAALAAAIWLHVLASRTHTRLDDQVTTAYGPPRPVMVDELADALGGDDAARAAAAAYLAEGPWNR